MNGLLAPFRVVCADCTGRHHADAVFRAFITPAFRDEWIRAHRQCTGHTSFWQLDEPLDWAAALAAYVADAELRDRLQAGRPVPEPPTVAAVLAELREALAHPEWRGHVPLQPDAARVLLDHVVALTEAAPEIACPDCGASIRARLADQPGETDDDDHR